MIIPKLEMPKLKLPKPANTLPKGATVLFTEEDLPFIFVAQVGFCYSDNSVKVHLQHGAAPQVAVIYGRDNPKHVRIARNDLRLPDVFLRHIYNMGRNRAIITSFDQMGLNPERKHGARHTIMHYFNKDKERVLKVWATIKVKFLNKISDYQK